MKNNKRGFTLIELIVVIAIIGVLVLLATPKFMNYTQEAKIARIVNDIKVIENEIEIYLIKNETLPTSWIYVDGSVLEQAKQERKLYNINGLVGETESAFNILTIPVYANEVTFEDNYKEISSNFINSKLKGNFYVGESKGNVYYIDNGKSEKEEEMSEGFIFNKDTLTIEGYNGNVPNNLTIPNEIDTYEVKVIGEGAFNNKQIKSLELPEGLEAVEKQAFLNNELTTLSLPNSIRNIKDNAFSNNKLKEIIIPNKDTNIQLTAFEDNQPDPKELTIYGYSLSPAENVANNKSYTFVKLDSSAEWKINRVSDSVLNDIDYITYKNGRYLGKKQSGSIVVSTDGINWSETNGNFGSSSYLRFITYGNGKYVAGGGFGKFATSTDGVNWTFEDGNLKDKAHITSAIYQNGRFIGTGMNRLSGGSMNSIFISTDGVNWTETYADSSVTNSLLPLYNENNKYIVIGGDYAIREVLTSTDGVNWNKEVTNIKRGGYYRTETFTFGNGLFLVQGEEGSIMTSSDAINWIKRDIGNASGKINSIIYGDGEYVAIGVGGTIISSKDGISWTEKNSDTTESLSSITYRSGQYVMIENIQDYGTSKNKLLVITK